MTDDCICATATPMGNGGISVIRLSGKEAVAIAAKVVRCRKGSLAEMKSHRLKFAEFVAETENGAEVLDEGVVGIFRAPCSYTGEDVVEFSCHASPYIVRRLLEALVAAGARMAGPGEFTMRAFLNGKMDLSQAEAVADLIAGESKAMHDIALGQLRGGFSSEIEDLRQRLLDFVSLVELELDFSEEDVEFADRGRLRELLREIAAKVDDLRRSFQTGNVLKEGIRVAIVGKPNAGKSTLLNALLHEERALVSDIPGTTRDTIEEVWQIAGVKFRFMDTAGLRQGQDEVERMGIGRTLEKMRQAQAWLYLFDMETMPLEAARQEVETWKRRLWADAGGDALEAMGNMPVIFVANKVDAVGRGAEWVGDTVYLSARESLGMDLLEDALRELIPEMPDANAVVLTNARHYEALGLVKEDLGRIFEGMESGLPGDLLAMDIRSAIDHLGLITGKILTDDVLGNVFSRFCIGK
ncbi:MAG: tRNA uridine-5-carboxymethylaminomethyl(34) synthesis GTPase MnmE [Bacteroidales bacterium]|nr:tRNA uridine-5-carboxymethylaminomethyl(34) synthesis GTPase MnmE [Bacteroidales bacterium]